MVQQQGKDGLQTEVKKNIAKVNAKGDDTNKCKTCNKEFASLQSCLAHEMIHLTVGNKNQGGKKKRKRRVTDIIKDEDTPDQKEFKSLVRTALSLCEEGTELNILCRLFQPIPENLNFVYERIHYDLQEELRLRGKWDIQPFGSTVTGMAFKCSDIDFYIENLNKDGASKNILRQLAKILHSSDKFSNIISIHSARVPIIKCTHNITGYNLDINVSSKLGVYNSRFIGKILAYDNRIHPLMLIIKIWANSWGLTKTGRMTNYCLTWLVVFYLQNCQPAVLPSVKEFQKDVPKNLVDGINFSINEKKKMKPLNTQNIKQLVQGFFKFYTTFDFSSYIVSPYLGSKISRVELGSNKFPFPEYYNQMKFIKQQLLSNKVDTPDFHVNSLNCNTLMVVQDAFVLNQNKSANIGLRVFNKLQKQIANANMIFNDPQLQKSSAMLLIRVLYEPPANLQVNNNAFAPAKTAPEAGNRSSDKTNFCKFSPMETELIYVRNHLRKHFPGQTFDKVEVNKFWTEKIVEFMGEILQDFFKIRMASLKKPPSKSPRTVGQLDIHNNKYTINCELEANVDYWSGRKTDIKKGYAAFLQEQVEITKRYESERIGLPTTSVKLHCTFSLQPESDFSAVTITMDDLIPATEKSSFKIFFTELTGRMRNFFKAFFERLSREHL